MSPPYAAEGTAAHGFPRVSGDEPQLPGWFGPSPKFSPRERG